MKNLTFNFLLLSLFLSSGNIFSQSVIWSNVLAGQQEDYGNALALDASGNVITTGSFQGICYGGSGSNSFALSSYGANDIYVQKLSPTGAILWTNQYSGSGGDNGHSVATDSSGNIYVTGTFSGTVYFGSGTLNSPQLDSNFFVIKLDPNGTLLWKKAIPGYSSHRPKIMVDKFNNLFLTGVFNGNRTFGSYTLESLDGLAYVTKLSTSTGNVIWIKQFGSGLTLDGTSTVVNITTSNFTTDSLGNIYVTGCFKGHGRFNGENVLISGSNPNAYIFKMDSSGTTIWRKFYTGATEGTDIVCDANNNLYVAGNYYGQSVINGNTYSSPSGLYSVYFEKLDSNGNLVWFKNYDLHASKHTDVQPKLAVDPAANIFFSCRFGQFSNTDTISFENQNFIDLVSTNPNILKPQILACFNTDGANLWAKQYETMGENIQFGIYPDKPKNIGVNSSGLFITSGSTKFNDVSYSSESGANIFVAKLSLPYILGNASFENEDEKINAYPNPTTGKINLDFSKTYSDVEIKVFNTIGQLVDTKKFHNTNAVSFDLTDQAGIFLLDIQLDGNKATSKVIKM